MKKYLFYLMLITVFISSCKEKATTPSSEYRLQVLDSTNTWVDKAKPYTAQVGEVLQVVPISSSDYSAIWPGDSVFSTKDTIKRVYVAGGMSDHQSIPLINGKATFSYTKSGYYNIKFVTTNVADNGKQLSNTVNEKEFITIIDPRSAITSLSLSLINPTTKVAYSVNGTLRADSIIFNELSTVNVNSVKVSFKTMSAQASVFVGSDKLISGTSLINLSAASGIEITVVAPDKSFTIYKVVNKPVVASTECELLTFNLASTPGSGVFNTAKDTLFLNIPYGTDTTKALSVLLTSSPNSVDSIFAGKNKYKYAGKALSINFTLPVKLMCIAQDNVTVKNYIIVTKEKTPFQTFTFDSLNPIPDVVIDHVARTITTKVVDPTKLIAVYTGNELAKTYINDTLQVNGKTVYNFTNPVLYKVKKNINATKKDSVIYTVTVSKFN